MVFYNIKFFLRFQNFLRIFDINNLVAFLIPMCILYYVYRARTSADSLNWIEKRGYGKDTSGTSR
jgi:phosphoglycerol transferase MdoB-like AlkP superfamily enzyme